jgi:hypothetical protein
MRYEEQTIVGHAVVTQVLAVRLSDVQMAVHMTKQPAVRQVLRGADERRSPGRELRIATQEDRHVVLAARANGLQIAPQIPARDDARVEIASAQPARRYLGVSHPLNVETSGVLARFSSQ